MNLSEYIQGRFEHCNCVHQQPCPNCSGMLYVARIIVDNGCFTLHHAFKIVSPSIKYAATRARTRLLHMPLVSLVHGKPSSGKSVTYLVEK